MISPLNLKLFLSNALPKFTLKRNYLKLISQGQAIKLKIAAETQDIIKERYLLDYNSILIALNSMYEFLPKHIPSSNTWQLEKLSDQHGKFFICDKPITPTPPILRQDSFHEADKRITKILKSDLQDFVALYLIEAIEQKRDEEVLERFSKYQHNLDAKTLLNAYLPLDIPREFPVYVQLTTDLDHNLLDQIARENQYNIIGGYTDAT